MVVIAAADDDEGEPAATTHSNKDSGLVDETNNSTACQRKISSDADTELLPI